MRDESGTSAVEFAIICPLFVFVLIAIIGFGTLFGLNHSVQQLASEAARASLAGITDQERQSLARAFVTDNLGSYPLLDPRRVTTAAGMRPGSSSVYEVTIVADISASFVFAFRDLLPLPPPEIRRSAAIARGGY